MDEGVTDSKTPDAGWGVTAKPQTRVWPKQRATTRSSKTRRAIGPAGERLLFLAAFCIKELFKQLKKKNASADYGRAEPRALGRPEIDCHRQPEGRDSAGAERVKAGHRRLTRVGVRRYSRQRLGVASRCDVGVSIRFFIGFQEAFETMNPDDPQASLPSMVEPKDS